MAWIRYPVPNRFHLFPFNLRTVRVTAAVYWDLHSEQRLLLLILQHLAGVNTYTSSYDLAGTCVFNKQSLTLIMCHFNQVALVEVPILPKLLG